MSTPLIVDQGQIREAPSGATLDLTQNIVKVAAPVEADDAATKQYVDDAVGGGDGGGDAFSGSYNDLTDTPDLSGFATTQALEDSLFVVNPKDGTMMPIYATQNDVDNTVSTATSPINDSLVLAFNGLDQKADRATTYTKAEVDAAVAAAGGGPAPAYLTARGVSAQVNVGANTQVNMFNITAQAGDVAFSPNPSGYTLKAGKTYRLSFAVSVRGVTAGNYVQLAWCYRDRSNFVPLVTGLITATSTAASTEYVQSVCDMIYTAPTDIIVAVAVWGVSATGTTCTLFPQFSHATIEQIA